MKKLLLILISISILFSLSACGKKENKETINETEEPQANVIDFFNGQTNVLSFKGKDGKGIATMNLNIENGTTLFEDETIKVIYNCDTENNNSWADVLKGTDLITKVIYSLDKQDNISNDEIITINLNGVEKLSEINYLAKDMSMTATATGLIAPLKSKYEIKDVEEIRNVFLDYEMSVTKYKPEEIELHNIWYVTPKESPYIYKVQNKVLGEYTGFIVACISKPMEYRSDLFTYMNTMLGAYYDETGKLNYDYLDSLVINYDGYVDIYGNEPEPINDFIARMSEKYIFEELELN